MLLTLDEVCKAMDYINVTEEMRRFLKSKEPKLARLLVRFWGAQVDVIRYKDIERAILNGEISIEVFDQWYQDYSLFVDQNLKPLWEASIMAALDAVGRKKAGYQYAPGLKNIEHWTSLHAAEFVTNIAEGQRNTLNALIRNTTLTGDMTVYELSLAIRPTIGLTKPQTIANINYYKRLRKSGLSIRNARKKAANDALRQHRYRAKVISENEIAVAYRSGEKIGIQDMQKQGLLKKVQKTWLTARDSGVCEICKKLNYQTVDFDRPFVYEGIEYWEDRGAHIRCRCGCLYREVMA